MEVNTKITNALYSSKSGSQVQYDQNVKEILSDRQIFARIIKYTLAEFSDMPIEDVIDNIGNVTTKPLEAGLTNAVMMNFLPTESSIQNEGVAFFDILGEVLCNKEQYEIIVNVEAQKTDNPEKLKYHIENRGVFYIGRMISSQKEMKFKNSDYDKLRKVKSIWICMNSAEDSIIRYIFKPEIVYGKFLGEIISGQMEMVLIRIRNDRNAEKSKNTLIAMLEDLLRNDSLEEKKKNLADYEIKMTETIEGSVNAMCNLSEAILEKGIEQGKIQSLVKQICNKLKKGKSPEMISEELEEELNTVKNICDIAGEYAPDYNVEDICNKIFNQE